MADQNAKSYFVRMILCTEELLGLLIMNLKKNSEIRNFGSNMADQDVK